MSMTLDTRPSRMKHIWRDYYRYVDNDSEGVTFGGHTVTEDDGRGGVVTHTPNPAKYYQQLFSGSYIYKKVDSWLFVGTVLGI